MKKYYILKPGKNDYGLGGTPLKGTDFLVIATAETTQDIKNLGNPGDILESPYITINDLYPSGSKAIISSGPIQVLQNYDFRAGSFRWILANGAIYQSPFESDFTLTGSDPVEDRIDALIGAIDNDGNGYLKIKPGVSGNPAYRPVLDDDANEILITFITVNAGTTTPAEVITTVIYDENIESTTSGAPDFDDVTAPKSGTKAIQFTNFVAGQEAKFVMTAPFNPRTQELFQFWLDSDGLEWNNKGAIDMAVFNGVTQVSDWVRIYGKTGKNEPYGFKSKDAGYQAVAIPGSAFFFSSDIADTFIFRKLDGITGNIYTFKMDLFRMQTGLSVSTGSDPLTFSEGITRTGDIITLGGNISAPIVFTDNRATTLGLQYNADYSAGWVDRSIPDKGYVDTAVAGATGTGLEKLTETTTGWRLIGKDPANFGDIGTNAIDFSVSSGASATRGSTGELSVTFGEDNVTPGYGAFNHGYGNIQAAGTYNFDFGESNVNNSAYMGIVLGYQNAIDADATESFTVGETNQTGAKCNITFGQDNINTGHSSGVGYSIMSGRNNYQLTTAGAMFGAGLHGDAFGMTVVGKANLAGTYANGSPNDHNQPAFVVGNGTVNVSTLAAAVRSDAFKVWYTGEVMADSCTTALIDTAARGEKILVTKEWITAQGYGVGSGDMVLASVQQNTGAKTFNDSTLKLRNVADTFSATVKAPVTAARDIIFQDIAYTGVADLTDLSGFVPYTGATGNVDLNQKQLNNVSQILLDGIGTVYGYLGSSGGGDGMNIKANGLLTLAGVNPNNDHIWLSTAVTGSDTVQPWDEDPGLAHGVYVDYAYTGGPVFTNTDWFKTIVTVGRGWSDPTVVATYVHSADIYFNSIVDHSTKGANSRHRTLYNNTTINGMPTGGRYYFIDSKAGDVQFDGGVLGLGDYGLGNIGLDTEVYNLGVDASGNVVEVTPGGGGGTNLQKEVTGATYTMLTGDDNYTIFFNRATAITVTVNDDLADNFQCDFYNLGAGLVSFVAGTATLGSPDGLDLATNKIGALIKFMANNNYKLKGEFV